MSPERCDCALSGFDGIRAVCEKPHGHKDAHMSGRHTWTRFLTSDDFLDALQRRVDGDTGE